ncbi:MAG TPA: FdhF/YdeP family oxidoreductase [Nocardioides sp.]|nr:FdhF/YdeP family oxidoreductase [Nocardioides sp.]
MTDQSAEERPEVGKPEHAAVGIPGIYWSMKYAMSEMGPSRSARTLLTMNHIDGFDCPSCAWPDPDRRKAAEFCENGAKAVAWEATRKRVGADFFAEHSVAELLAHDDHWLESQGRLTEPMYLPPGGEHYRPISWNDAFRLVAARLDGMESPDRAVFYTSGRASNEAAFVYQLLARRLGTNNLPDCSNMCHESSGTALTETLGESKGTVTYDDIAFESGLILIAGQNPGTNHPRMLTALEQAKKKGATIVAINPLPEAGLIRFRNPQTARGVSGIGTKMADVHLPVRLNGDLALFAGLNKLLVERGAVERDFIEHSTDGYDVAAEAWSALDWSTIESHSGLRRTEIEALADRVEAHDRVIVCWAMGLTQHKNSVATIREIVSFLLLRGNIGRPGAGAAPIRGHSNVQGDRTMGIWEQMADSFLDAIRDEFGFEPPREHGTDTVAALQAMLAGGVDVFVGLGGNFAVATPDTAAATRAMENVGLTVGIHTKLNRSHLHHGREALILPCLGRTERDITAAGEQFVTVEDSMSMVHSSRGRLLPGSPHLRSEVQIICGIAEALFGSGDGIDWSGFARDYSLIRRHIAHVVPGFHAFEERVAHPGGFQLPNPARDSREFDTSTGKARITANPLTAVDVPDGHLLLQTLRSHDQFNTTVYGYDDRYRGVKHGRNVVFVNPDDLRSLGIEDGDTVDLVSVAADGERRLTGLRAVSYPTAAGCAATYYPEGNVLVPLGELADESRTPVYKSLVVRLERVSGS